jgi:hypothetical protein
MDCARLSFIVKREGHVMPNLTVPEQHASGFARIIGLSSEESQHVVDALSLAKSVKVKELADIIGTALPALTKDQAREIVGALLSLYSARTGMDLTVDAFVTALLEASHSVVESVDGHELPSRDTIEKTLRDLLSIRPLSMIAKARNLHADHENTFCAARILTDLRAVFDVDVKEVPAGFVMTHILKLAYHHAGKHTELHVAMDKVDVDNLLLALQRAKTKAATLTAISNRCGFSVLAD